MGSMPEGPRIDKPQTVAPKPHAGRVARRRRREPSALVVLREAQMTGDRIVHRGEETVDAADEVAPGDIGFDEIRRELEEQALGRDRDAAQLEIMRLLIGVPVELVELVPERPDREVM